MSTAHKPMFELEATLEAVLARIEELSGPEATEEEQDELARCERELAELLASSTEKRDAVAYFVRREVAEGDAAAELAREFSERARVHRNRAERARDTVVKIMQALGRDELAGAAFRFRLAQNPASVQIVDEKAIPELYKHTETVIEKAAIGKALKSGVDVPGAALAEPKYRVDIKAR